MRRHGQPGAFRCAKEGVSARRKKVSVESNEEKGTLRNVILHDCGCGADGGLSRF